MSTMSNYPRIVFLLALAACGLSSLSAQCTATNSSDVTTGQYNSYRTGANEAEANLTPANVNTSEFGYLFSLSVDTAAVFAQPLVIHNLTIGGTNYCTVVFIATMDNYIYAFNGDAAPTQAAPYIWKSAQFGTPVPYAPYTGFTTMGIMDTPVIDVKHQILYFVSLAEEGVGPTGWAFRLHAISITTGLEYFPADRTAPGGVVISGSVPGTGDNAVNGVVPFVPSEAKERSALLNVGGSIYITFGFGTPGSGYETNPYHGWAFAYKSCLSGSTTCATDPPCFSGATCGLQQISILNTTPNSHGGGIWMSGRGPTSDGAGNVFTTVGNGCLYGGNPALCGPDEYSEAVVNLATLDYFLPTSPTVTQLDYSDLDFDAGGIFMIPPTPPAAVSSYLVAGGKTGTLEVLTTTGLAAQTGNPYQMFQATGVNSECPNNLPIYDEPPLYSSSNPTGCDEYRSSAYWSRGTNGYLYVWGFNDSLRAYGFNTTNPDQFDPTPVATYTPATLPSNGGILAVSSLETADAILWAITGTSNYTEGVLSAYRLWNPNKSEPVLDPLWNSFQNGKTFFPIQRFTVPVISHGKVFVPTTQPDSNGNTQVLVYGLCAAVAGGCATLVTSQYLLKSTGSLTVAGQ